MKIILLIIVMLSVSAEAFSQFDGPLSKLDTIPAIPIEFQNQDSLAILNYKIIESFKIGADSILIYNDIGSSVKLIVLHNEIIELAEIGVKYIEAKEMNLYSHAKDLTYTAYIDSLGTMNPYIIVNWVSTGISTSSLCFGNSGFVTNKETRTQRGFTLIDLKNSTIVFSGLAGYSTRNTNMSEGGIGGGCSRVTLNLESNILSIKHISNHAESQLRDEIQLIGGSYTCPENNTLYFYDFEITENTDYQLKNGLFVKVK